MSDLPSGWAWTTLDEVTMPQTASVSAAATGLPYLGLDGVETGSTRILTYADSAAIRGTAKPFAPGYTLYARLRPYLNKVCAPDQEGVSSAEFIVFGPSLALSPRYLLYLLNSQAFVEFANRNAEGIERPRLSWQRMRAFAFGLPPLSEQQRMVVAIEEHLSRLDAAARSLAQARRRLSAVRSATRSAATRGHAAVALGSLVSELRYGTSTKCSYDGGGPPVLRIPNVQDGNVDTSDLKFATDSDVDLSSFMLKKADLLFVRTNGSRDLIGRVAVVDGAEGMAFASYLIRARLDESRLDPIFAVMALSAPASRAFMERRAATSAGQYNLNLAALRALPVPLPSIEDQRSIVAEVERRLSVIDASEREIERATRQSSALRRAILARAFRGDLVLQDPKDEPASVLLERIAAERAAAPKSTRKRREKAPA